MQKESAIGMWHTNNQDKILTVSSKGISEDETIAILKSKGFRAEPIV